MKADAFNKRENIDAADAAVPVVAESSEAMKNLQRRRQYKLRNLHNGNKKRLREFERSLQVRM